MTRHYYRPLILLAVLFAVSLALYAQAKRTLVLTNHSTQAIWVDKVIYDEQSLPAGYLPPKGRIYLALDKTSTNTLQIRWHQKDKQSHQQQTLVLSGTGRYLIFTYDGMEFRQLQDE
jgi:hypothetical protein